VLHASLGTPEFARVLALLSGVVIARAGRIGKEQLGITIYEQGR